MTTDDTHVSYPYFQQLLIVISYLNGITLGLSIAIAGVCMAIPVEPFNESHIIRGISIIILSCTGTIIIVCIAFTFAILQVLVIITLVVITTVYRLCDIIVDSIMKLSRFVRSNRIRTEEYDVINV